MTHIPIDFAPMTLSRLGYLTSPRIWLTLAVGATLCLVVGWKVNAVLEQIESEQHTLTQLAAQNHRVPTKPVARTALPESQSLAVSHAIDQLNLPWSDALDALEAATPNSIALISLEPDAKRRLIKAVAEAKNSDDMIDYVERLKKQNFFLNVVLTKHDVNEQDVNRPLRFQFDATWQETL